MTTKQFAETVLAGIPWYIYLLTFIGVGLIIRDIIRYGYKALQNLSSANRTKRQAKTSGPL